MAATSALPQPDEAVEGPVLHAKRHSFLWIKHAPDDHLVVRDGITNGLVYDEQPGRDVIQVEFTAVNGRATRVSFDPETGAATTRDITRERLEQAGDR